MIKSSFTHKYQNLQENTYGIQKCFSDKVKDILQNIESLLFGEENNKGLIYKIKEDIKNIVYNFPLYKEKKLREELDRIIGDILVKFAYHKITNNNYSPEKASKEYMNGMDGDEKGEPYPFLTKFFQEGKKLNDKKIIQTLKFVFEERIKNYNKITTTDTDEINKYINTMCSEFSANKDPKINDFVEYLKIFLENIFKTSSSISTTVQ